MESVFKAISAALSRGEDAVLSTIIESNGSVPRGEGAKMAVFTQGTEGTVGGGPVEFACEKMGRAQLALKASAIKQYELSASKAATLGMVCGGDVEVLFVYLSHANAQATEVVQAILEAYGRGEDAWLVYRYADGQATIGLYTEAEGLQCLPDVDAAEIEAMRGEHTAMHRDGDTLLLVEPLVQAGMVYVFGGGHVSQALVPVLRTVAFRTAVFEDRPEFVADGILGDYAKISDCITITDRDYVVIMTRGHLSDAVVLEQVLRTPARYIGMIGSRKKLAATKERLLAAGFGEADFARMHSPIGLPIGGSTPQEIAISIAAEMIQVRSGGKK